MKYTLLFIPRQDLLTKVFLTGKHSKTGLYFFLSTPELYIVLKDNRTYNGTAFLPQFLS